MGLDVRFTAAARKHRISRAAARYVMDTTRPADCRTKSGAPGLRWTGTDELGRRLEVIAVELAAAGGRPPCLLVIHVMQMRGRGR